MEDQATHNGQAHLDFQPRTEEEQGILLQEISQGGAQLPRCSSWCFMGNVLFPNLPDGFRVNLDKECRSIV